MDYRMIDATSGGALMDKMSAVVRHLISNMASNTTRGVIMNRAVNEVGTVDNLRLENQLTELTSLVRQLVVGHHQQIPPVKICGICTSVEHSTNMCPTLWKPIRSTIVSNSIKAAAVHADSESRVICSPKIWIRAKHAGSKSQLLLATGTEISNVTIPTTATTNANT
ncbi:hypothetical protein CR513_49059, partial [Mucuna pruriens]